MRAYFVSSHGRSRENRPAAVYTESDRTDGVPLSRTKAAASGGSRTASAGRAVWMAMESGEPVCSDEGQGADVQGKSWRQEIRMRLNLYNDGDSWYEKGA